MTIVKLWWTYNLSIIYRIDRDSCFIYPLDLSLKGRTFVSRWGLPLKGLHKIRFLARKSLSLSLSLPKGISAKHEVKKRKTSIFPKTCLIQLSISHQSPWSTEFSSIFVLRPSLPFLLPLPPLAIMNSFPSLGALAKSTFFLLPQDSQQVCTLVPFCLVSLSLFSL